MPTRRTFVLASALVLLVPAAVLADPATDILTYGAQVVYELTDIDGVAINPNPLPGKPPEQHEMIVEGHTTFTTINIIRPPPPPPKEINVVGLVECHYEILGVSLDLSHIDRVFVECSIGGRIWLSPSTMSVPTAAPDLAPTGWTAMVRTPDTHESVLVTEYSYSAHDRNASALAPTVRAYCWLTQIVAEGLNPSTGHAYNFVGAINLERMREMHTNRVDVYVGDQRADGIVPAATASPTFNEEPIMDPDGVFTQAGVQSPQGEAQDATGMDQDPAAI